MDLCGLQSGYISWNRISVYVPAYAPIPNPQDNSSTICCSFNIKYIDLPFAIDLSAPFNPTEFFTSKAFVSIRVPESLPATLRGAIWVDEAETIYKQAPNSTRPIDNLLTPNRFGGAFPDSDFWAPKNGSKNLDLVVRPAEIWALETVNFTWNKLPPPGGDPVSGVRSGGGAYSSELGFLAGGHLNNRTDSKFANWTGGESEILNTLLTYDMANNTFVNKTTPFDPFTLSNLVHVPVGEKGILLSLGGISIKKGMFNWTFNDIKNVPLPHLGPPHYRLS